MRLDRVAIHDDGSVVVGGSFAGTFDVGLGPVTVKSEGRVSAFVAGFDPTGSPRFSFAMGEDCEDDGDVSVNALAMDGTGNVYVVVDDECPPYGWAFAKIEPGGQIVWTKAVSGFPRGDLLVAAPGSIVFSAYRPVVVDGYQVPGTGDELGALVKLDGNLDVVWVTSHGAGCRSGPITMDSSGNTYVARTLGDFDPIVCDGETLVEGGDAYGPQENSVSKYDPSGKHVATWKLSLPTSDPGYESSTIDDISVLSNSGLLLAHDWFIPTGTPPPEYGVRLTEVGPEGNIRWSTTIEDDGSVYPRTTAMPLPDGRVAALVRDGSKCGESLNFTVLDGAGNTLQVAQSPSCYPCYAKEDPAPGFSAQVASNFHGRVVLAAVYEGECSTLVGFGGIELPAHDPAGFFVSVFSP